MLEEMFSLPSLVVALPLLLPLVLASLLLFEGINHVLSHKEYTIISWMRKKRMGPSLKTILIVIWVLFQTGQLWH